MPHKPLHSCRNRSAVRAAVLFACVCIASSQSQVRSLNVVATDQQGLPVTDLVAADFQIFDDGKPQPILLFQANDYRHPASASALAPHEYANRNPDAPKAATMIVFDLVNGLPRDRDYMVSKLTKALTGIESSGNVYLYLLTHDGTLLPINSVPVAGNQRAASANWTRDVKQLLDGAIQKVYGFRPQDVRDDGFAAISALNALHDLGALLSTISGRKNLVWITNGFPLQIPFGVLCHNIVVQNVTVPCTQPQSYVDFTSVVRHLSSELDAAGVSLYPAAEWDVDGGARLPVKETMDEFANITAGRSYLSGGVEKAVVDAMQAMGFNYTIRYQPTLQAEDGKVRKIRVTCARKGVQIKSEREYVAETPVDEVSALLQLGSVEKSDLAQIGLRAMASPGNTPNTIHVRFRIDASDLAILQQNGHYSGQLAALYTGLADGGTEQLQKRPMELEHPKRLTLDWSSEQYAKVVDNWIPIDVDLRVTSGVQKVRIVIVDTRSNAIGTLTIPLT